MGGFCTATKHVPAVGVSVSGCVFSSLTPPVRLFSVTPPTPQPIDDVDIYFETPADDKEHSRFQRAKEQLEIRHRSRMERVRGSLLHKNELRDQSAICHPFKIQALEDSVCCWNKKLLQCLKQIRAERNSVTERAQVI